MGKDNVYFHTVYFPSMQLGDGRDWTTLHHISTTGESGTPHMRLFCSEKNFPAEYLNYEGGKFSKSRSRGVFGVAAKETGIPPSVWRYYLLSTRPETADAMFSWVDCVSLLSETRTLRNSLTHLPDKCQQQYIVEQVRCYRLSCQIRARVFL
jgi:methionyl-tRNA synthetase